MLIVSVPVPPTTVVSEVNASASNAVTVKSMLALRAPPFVMESVPPSKPSSTVVGFV